MEESTKIPFVVKGLIFIWMIVTFIHAITYIKQPRVFTEYQCTVEKAWSDEIKQTFLFISEEKTKYYARISVEKKYYTIEVDGPYEIGDILRVEVFKENNEIAHVRYVK